MHTSRYSADCVPWHARVLAVYDMALLGAAAAAAAVADVLAGRVAPRRLADWDYVWSRYFYGQCRDCWDRPLGSVAAAHARVLARHGPWDGGGDEGLSGAATPCINLGSYNYLGWGEAAACFAPAAAALARDGPVGAGSGAAGALEAATAAFLHREAAVVMSTGFVTNASGLPALLHGLAERGGVVLSDALNHASIVTGLRTARVAVRVFRHNDAADVRAHLDALGRDVPVWVVVEGVYSMEGDVCPLPDLLKLRAEYGFRLYVDEAHSIGALGATGRGVCEHYGVDPAAVDVLMGTFTKAFAACGGYMAGDAETIGHVRRHCLALRAEPPLAAPLCAQIAHVFRVLDTDGGRARVRRLQENARWLRAELRRRGYVALGDGGTPVIPWMTYRLRAGRDLSRRCLRRGVALVYVGYPAAPLWTPRMRLCVSSEHTKEDLVRVVEVLDEEARGAGVPRV